MQRQDNTRRLFTEQFIEEQKRILAKLSAKHGSRNGEILSLEIIEPIFDAMREITVANAQAINKNNYQKINEPELTAFIKIASCNLNKLTSPKNHALFSAINENLYNTANKVFERNFIGTPISEEKHPPTNPHHSEEGEPGETEVAFSNVFIRKQRNIVEHASKIAGLGNLQNKNDIARIENHMRALRITAEEVISEDGQKNYLGLINLLDTTIRDFDGMWKEHSSCCVPRELNHPLDSALKQIKTNIIESLNADAPAAMRAEIIREQQRKRQESTANWNKHKDRMGIFACGLWSLIQKPVTLLNGCEPCVSNSTSACCPESRAITKNNWNLCSPFLSIKFFKKDIQIQNNTLMRLQNERLGISLLNANNEDGENVSLMQQKPSEQKM